MCNVTLTGDSHAKKKKKTGTEKSVKAVEHEQHSSGVFHIFWCHSSCQQQ